MLTPSFAFAVLTFVLLLLFFSGLPNLKTCELPRMLMKNEPDRQNRLAVMLITLLYALCAFWNLGNTASPQTFAPMEGRDVILRLPGSTMPDRLVLFPGVGQGTYSIEYSNDAEGWYPQISFTQDHVSVLKWQYLPLNLSAPVNFLRIHCTSGTPWLGEIALWDAAGNSIAAASSIPELTDEGLLVPPVSDFLNSSYFDEIYHARTAWEHLHGIWPYEISHPPLGKEILSLGILLFGMTPFGWRFSGTVVGILMLPAMYRFLKRLFGTGRVPVLGTALLASGFLHYVQTRIATIDSYAVFFILLMYDAMYAWLTERKTRHLAICGVLFGLGAACKWICLYAGAGLGVLWLGHWILELLHSGRGIQPETSEPSAAQSIPHRTALGADRDGADDKEDLLQNTLPGDAPENESLPQSESRQRTGISARVLPAFLKNAALCMLFFVLIPGLIYYLSYLPYGISQHAPLFSRDYTKLVLDNQTFMFSYHAHIKAEHPYSSRWYQWVLDIRPILYYLEYLPDGKRVSFGAFVNPMICWGGLLSLLVMAYTAAARRDRTAAFLLAAYGSGLVPWMFISRLTFAYHYFASALFLVPSLCYVFSLFGQAPRRFRRYPTYFTAFAVLLFAWFFPALNGITVQNDLATKLLGWLPTWPF